MKQPTNSFAELRALTHLCRGEHATVRAIDGGRLMTQRMSMLGIRPGADLCVVQGPGTRGAVVLVGGARIALGRGVIEHIRVESRPAAEVPRRSAGRP